MNLQERITVSLLATWDSFMNLITFGAWEKQRGKASSNARVHDSNRQ